ncbi:MAG TPA: DUF2889 domain-containing protein, partial [Ilumatobacteraceae bacterium]|nr:DUF2889 domain-containing protein [Ilumatobacteraceae bacterium]
AIVTEDPVARWRMVEPMADRPPLHPQRGVHAPLAGSPARQPGSVRRTSTMATHRPDGIAGPVIVTGRGRDLLTLADGSASVIATASVDVEVAYIGRREILSISSSPDVPGLQGLVGTAASSGFRRQVSGTVDIEPGSLLNLLLDDLPVALLVSGVSMMFAGLRPMFSEAHPAHPDICAGWQSGGSIMTEIARTGSPGVPTGPDAPSVLVDDDPLAWHELPDHDPNTVCRHRRLDLVAGSPARFDCFFRDQHVSFGGRATSVHEYTVRGALSDDRSTIASIEAVPGALPWRECDQAAPSAARLIGRPLDGLRAEVATSFTGITTCTHLNDQLRSLADLAVLDGALEQA